MRLIEIPWSHNCIKVRLVLDHKRVPCEVVAINGLNRLPAKRASGQWLVPVLVDEGSAIADSTAIALHVERRHPDPALLPEEASARAECLMLEEWADSAFMRLSRRLAYATVSAQEVGEIFFPGASPRAQALRGAALRRLIRRRFGIADASLRRDFARAPELARVAVDRLGGRAHLVGDALTLADIALATMAGPLAMADEAVRDDPAVRALTDWCAAILGDYTYSIDNLRRRSREALLGA